MLREHVENVLHGHVGNVPHVHRLRRLHADERGSISILTVFAVFVFVLVLGMVMNVGRQVDGKIRMQNAADSAAYSGGLVIARGLNTLVFTNHMMSEVLALTAFLSEARDRNSENFTAPILAAWSRMAPVLAGSKFPKFEELANAIPRKTSLEQEMVKGYCDWVAAVAPSVLPVMEEILRQEAIPQFQRNVVALYPHLAQAAATEVAEQEGRPNYGRGTMVGVLWRTSGRIVGGDSEAHDPTLPVIDPMSDPAYQRRARETRDRLARHYLREWNDQALRGFDRFAKMCQFASLWRGFTCAYLEELLNQYSTTNLPILLRDEIVNTTAKANSNAYLDQYFTFLGVVYWGRLPEFAPWVFRNPLTDAAGNPADASAFAEVRVYIPRPRLMYWWWTSPADSENSMGGVPGEILPMPPGSNEPSQPVWRIRRQPGATDEWSLSNQRWTAQLVPATIESLAMILQTAPPVPEFQRQGLRLPSLGRLGTSDIARVNTH